MECRGIDGHEVKGMIIQVEVTGSERDTWQETRGRRAEEVPCGWREGSWIDDRGRGRW